MPHTNTIEALTLELDRVNEQKRELLAALKWYVENDDTDLSNSDNCYFIKGYTIAKEAIQKAESR